MILDKHVRSSPLLEEMGEEFGYRHPIEPVNDLPCEPDKF
jgi:hypothetical protein